MFPYSANSTGYAAPLLRLAMRAGARVAHSDGLILKRLGVRGIYIIADHEKPATRAGLFVVPDCRLISNFKS